MYNILELLEAMQDDVLEPLLLHFFFIFALGHFISRYIATKRHRTLTHVLIGMFIGAIQSLLLLFPARIGAYVTIQPTSLIVLVAFGFFGRIAGFITLGITLLTYFLTSPVYPLLGLIPYVFASVVPYFARKYLRNSKRRIPHQVVFLGLILVNSLLIFATIIAHEDTRDNLALALVALFIILPIIGMLLGSMMYNERQKVLNHLETEKREWLQSALINAPRDLEILALDHNYNYLSFNDFHAQRASQLFETAPEVGKNFVTMFDDARIRARLEASISRALSGETFDVEVEIEGMNGLMIHDFYNPIRDDNGNVIGVTIISYEITERKAYERSIRFFSYHDKLTGLYNRRYFDEYIDELALTDKKVMIVYTDINGLKIMNDVFGHDNGDKLLTTVASAISKAFSNGIVARTGGDEIVAIIEQGDIEKIKLIINKTREMLLKKTIKGIEVSVSFSEPLITSGRNIYQALQQAEDSMYVDKQRSSARHHNNVINVVLRNISSALVNPAIDEEVATLIVKFGEQLKLSPAELRNLQTLSRLRIVGNVMLEDEMQSKIIIKEHYNQAFFNKLLIAYRLILINKDYNLIAADLTSLYENYDGTGLPRALNAKEIPYKARMLRIVKDYVEYMFLETTDKAQVIAKLKAHVGTKYDPELFKVFLTII